MSTDYAPGFAAIRMEWGGEQLACVQVMPEAAFHRLHQGARREDPEAVLAFAERMVAPGDRDAFRRVLLSGPPEAVWQGLVSMVTTLLPEYLRRLGDSEIVRAN